MRFTKEHIRLAYEAGWDAGIVDSKKDCADETFHESVEKLIAQFKKVDHKTLQDDYGPELGGDN